MNPEQTKNSVSLEARDRLLCSLVEQIAVGNERALAEFYERTKSPVYSLALRILGSEPDAEEVTLDAYRKLWRLAPTFRSDRGSVFGWLLMITRHLAIDRSRKTVSHADADFELDRLPSLLPSQEDETLLLQMRTRLRDALECLSPEQKEAVEMAFFGGLAHPEISAQTGRPLGTVKSHIRSGLAKMRRILESKD